MMVTLIYKVELRDNVPSNEVNDIAEGIKDVIMDEDDNMDVQCIEDVTYTIEVTKQ